jgi:squalene-associated FAD-dependent desaturase
MKAPHVLVAGGGLAGITAAITLADAGARVTLAEARPRLGGATTSFSRDGLTVDNGQHVFLRCCTAYRDLLARLGVTGGTVLQDRFEITVLSPAGAVKLRRNGMPAPLHLGSALAGYSLLSRAERAGAIRAAMAFGRLDLADPRTDQQRLGDWLGARGQGPHARRMLWDLFVVSSLNMASDDASLALAGMVIKTALLGAADGADIGIPRVPLGELHGQAAANVLARLGADVQTSSKVTGIERTGAGFRVRLGQSGLDADGVVLAVPPEAAAALFPGAAVPPAGGAPPADGARARESGTAAAPAPAGAAGGSPGPDSWRRLGASPIVNLHVIYDQPVTRLPFAAAVDSPVQWVFDRTAISGCDRGQYLAVSLSAADQYAGERTAQLRARFLPALEQLFPAAVAARVTDFFVTRERRATFRQVPGTAALRPGAATAISGLVLAGAWTDTGWPDTMEGAVRSGLEAARVLVDQQGQLGQLAGQAPGQNGRTAALPARLARRVAGAVGAGR